MLGKKDYSPKEWTLLGLAGAFNAEQARWNVRKGPKSFEVTRETDEPYPHDLETMAHCKTLEQALDLSSSMSDIAAAVAFIREMSKIGKR